MTLEYKGEIRFENFGQDSPTSCPAVKDYTRYSPNGPKPRSESFEIDIDEYAPQVVERMHSMLVKIGERTK